VRSWAQGVWNEVDRKLYFIESAIVLALLASTMFLGFAQIVARWMGGGWIWADELVRFFVLWIGVFGAAPATRNHKHIAIDVIVKAMPRTPRRWVRAFTDLTAAAVSFILVKATVDYIEFFGSDPSNTLGVEKATLIWPLAVGFSWIGLRFLMDAIFGVEVDESEQLPISDSDFGRDAEARS